MTRADRCPPSGTLPPKGRTSDRIPVIVFAVPGLPVPQGDLSAGKHGKLYHKGKFIERWRHDIGWRARKAMRENGFDLLTGPVCVTVYFVMRRPQGLAKSKPTPPALKRPDLDKLTRAAFDAMTGLVYVDDSQIIEDHCYKRTAEVDEDTGVTICVDRIVSLGDWKDE